MKTVNNLPHLSTVLSVFMLVLFVSACSHEDALVEKTFVDSDGIKGIVRITSPKAGSLLHLRGIVGKGEFITQREDRDGCISIPIRFAAGDFEGSNISIQSVDSINLAIYSNEAARKLIVGHEVVSEDYHVTDPSNALLGDIHIESGLTLSYGFVLNPGEWSWSSLMSSAHTKTSCHELQK
jgi:hypothetical protein